MALIFTLDPDRPARLNRVNYRNAVRMPDIVEVIDAAKGAGVGGVGIITEGMRTAAHAQTVRH